MSGIAPQFIVWILCHLVMGISSAVLLVIGIMIAANKTKQTKVLGIGYIITSISSGAVFFYNVLLLLSDTKEVVVYGDAVMIGTIICVLASSLCVCIYIHKNYGKKLIYVPVLLIPVAGLILEYGATVTIAKLYNGFVQSMVISLVNDVTNFVSVTVMAIVILVVLYKNREKEKIIPKAWLVKTITVIGSVIEIAVICITYLAVIKSSESEGMMAYSDTTVVILSMVQAMDSLVAIIVPVYVLSKVSKASKKEKTAA